MINVNEITAKLAQLPDRQLQQYAAMNKSDPYILSLAMSESNRRKAMRSAAQAKAAPQQPKVADQAVADMAQPMPEDVGIGQLDAGDMNYADGGIVGYADGGVLESNPLAAAPLIPLQRQVEQARIAYAAAAKSGDARATQLYMGRLAAAQQALEKAAADFGGSAGQAVAEAQNAVRPQPSMTPFAGEADTAQQVPGITLPAAQQYAATQQDAAAQQKPAPQGIGTPQAAAPDYAQAKSGLQSLVQGYDITPAEQEIKRSSQEQVRAQEAARTREEAFQKDLGEYGAEREKQLKGREQRIEKDTQQSKGMAIFQAGLAMMSGTSSNALVNIGRGASVGAAQFKDDMREIGKRRDQLEEAYSQLADAKRSDKKDRFSRMEAIQGKIDDINAKTSDKLANLYADKGKVDHEDSRALAQMAVQAENARLGRETQLQIASMPGQTQRMYEALGNGDVEAGMRAAKAIEAGKFNPMDAYGKYLQAFAGKETLTPPMTFTQFKAQFGLLSTTAPEKSTKIRSLE